MNSWATRTLKLYLQVMLNAQRTVAAGKDGIFFGSLVRVARLECDSKESDAIEPIELMREELATDERRLTIQDYGAGVSPHSLKNPTGSGGRSVSAIHASSAIPSHWGVLLFRLVRELKPRHVLELGTNLGVSACYIRAAMDLNENEGRLVTIEGDPTLASMAKENLARVSSGNVDVMIGKFQDILPSALDSLGSVDLVFIDGHHEEEPTYRYYHMIKPYATNDIVMIFDDIYLWSRPVRRAWKRIVAEERRAVAIDLAKIGILKFNS